MSGTKAIKENQRNGSGQKAQTSQKNAKGFIQAFNPTEEEKRAIKDDARSSDEVLVSLEGRLQDGNPWTVKYNEKSSCFMVLVRDGAAKWDEAGAISCWHRSLDMCFRMLDYALTYRYPDWPNVSYQREFSDVDW